MDNKIFRLFLVSFTLLSGLFFSQECPSSATLNAATDQVPNTCSSNGQIIFKGKFLGSLTLNLKKNNIIVATANPPQSTPADAESTYTFSGLSAGTYDIEVKCTNTNATITTVTQAVAENYVSVTNATITESNLCTTFEKGATLTISNVMGGNPPYQYSVIKTNDPGYPDSNSQYTSNPVVNVNDFGTYQIRIKDNCNSYTTFTKTIGPTMQAIKYYWKPKKVCNSSNGERAVASFWFAFDENDGGIDINSFINSGLKLKIQDTDQNGAVLFDGLVNASNPTFTYNVSPNHVYWVTSTNACGIQVSYQIYYWDSINNGEIHDFKANVITSGCGASETLSISGDTNDISYWNFPATLTVKNNSGTVIYTKTVNEFESWSVNNLPVADYTVTMTDSCGNTVTKNLQNPRNAGPATAVLRAMYKWRCNEVPALTQNGTTQVEIFINGYVPNRETADIKIINGPSNVGISGVYIDNSWVWSNMLPGTYTVEVTSCGITSTTTFTVDNSSLLEQSLSSVAESFCSAGGNIISNKMYNGSYQHITELLDTNGNVIETSTTGSFYNQPAGTYKTRIKVSPSCTPSVAPYYIEGNEVTISNSSTGPAITKKIGIVCEDGSGQPLNTGTAYLDLSGVAPYVLRYRVNGTSNWTIINNANSTTAISNLVANTLYDIELSDACGGSISDQINISTVNTLTTENTVHPCYNAPYQLSVPDYAGATYEWTNAQNVVVSTSRIYAIADYNASYDGMYTCKITWDGCVTRLAKVTIDGTKCGTAITDVCYKDAGTNTPALPAKHGITALSRAGVDNSNWPMVRNGAHTVLESKTKGFVINRLSSNQKEQLNNPVEGMIVYDTTLNCLSIYNGSTWKCYSTQTCAN